MSKNKPITNQIVESFDEKGRKHKFKLLEIIEIDEQEYGIFEYLDNKTITNNEEPEDDLMVMKISVVRNESYFEIIEDEEEFAKVTEYIEAFRDELNLE